VSTRFEGKVALVTGGGSGIGEAIARRLAAESARVIIMDVRAESAERVASDLPQASPFTGDVPNPGASEAAVAHAVETFGGLHIAPNIAGIGGRLISTEECPIEDWRQVIDIRVLGITRAAAIDCAERGVRVNCVGRAVIRTPLLAASRDQAGADYLASLNPFGRLGEPEEVAAVVAWLASDEASFVSESFYAVDGAFTAR
jgi:NAD(P)-dependent dehydrogenase (short-subunit alcohol dehydrogenase family)